MRAVIISKPGPASQLVVRNVPEPLPGAGEVLIKVRYAGCNWADTQKRRGVYPVPVEYPTVAGLEVAGEVLSKGSGVRGFAPGDRVAAIVSAGGYAERAVASAACTIKLPQELSLRTGAAFPIIALTAYHLLRSAYRLVRGETVLVHAIGGGVGLMLTQLATEMGAKVIGTVGRASKARLPRAYGASLVIDRSRQDFVEEVRHFTDGRGVDLAIDSLGAEVLPRTIEALRRFGTVISIGEAAGYPDFPIRAKLHENSTFLGRFNLMHAEPGSIRWRRGVRYVVDRLESGTLSVPIEKVFPFDAVSKMHERLEGRSVSGKLLLDCRPTGR
jgi:NADPH2:quinone reductase